MILELINLLGVLALLMALLYLLIKNFEVDIKNFYVLFLALIIFSIGFSLRLTDQEKLVGFGFFMTEISFLFVNVLFTAALLLGQLKYWKAANTKV
jgi:hypothetical protein